MKNFTFSWHNLLCCLRDVMRGVAKPIVQELPFVVFMTLLNSIEILQNIHGWIVSQDPTNTLIDFACRLCNSFVFVYVLTWLVLLLHRRWIKVFLYVIMLILFAVNYYVERQFQMMISPQLITLIFETNRSEATEFISTYFSNALFIRVLMTLMLLIIVIVVAEYIYAKKLNTWFKKLQMNLAFCLIPLLGLGIAPMGNYFRLFNAHKTDNVISWNTASFCHQNDLISKILYSTKSLCLVAEEMHQSIATTKNMRRDNRIVSADTCLNVVMVIGESYNRTHAGIYGYSLPTTPNMRCEAQEGRLIIFTSVSTPYNVTSPIMRNVLCCNSIGLKEKWNETPFFPAIMHSAGYNVYYWDNQKSFGVNEGCTFAMNSFIYNDEIIKLSYNNLNSKSYPFDGQFIDSFKNEVTLSPNFNFVMLHLMGQHVKFAERFPNDEHNTVFTSDSIHRTESYINDEKKQLIADYDNATLYNDHVMDMIFDIFKKSNSIVVYFSDHGEEVYDYQDQLGRDGNPLTPQKLKHQYQVPFVVWCSDSYRTNHPQTMLALQKAATKLFSIDNVCNIIFNIANVQTSYYREQLDPLSDNYVMPRRVVEDNYDFDEIMSAAN